MLPSLGAEDSYRTAGCLPDGALGVAACVSSRLRGTGRNSNSQDGTRRTRLRRFLPQSAWQSEERGMEDRPNAEKFTERTAEGRAGFRERSRPRIIDRRPTPVRAAAHQLSFPAAAVHLCRVTGTPVPTRPTASQAQQSTRPATDLSATLPPENWLPFRPESAVVEQQPRVLDVGTDLQVSDDNRSGHRPPNPPWRDHRAEHPQLSSRRSSAQPKASPPCGGRQTWRRRLTIAEFSSANLIVAKG
jgi:hypothetical protein